MQCPTASTGVAGFAQALQEAVAIATAEQLAAAGDAVAVLPHVDERTIALQGTSLGGFVSASSASLDGRYDAVFLMLAGGDLHDIIMHGEKDAAKVRQKLEEHGLVDEKLTSAVQRVVETAAVSATVEATIVMVSLVAFSVKDLVCNESCHLRVPMLKL